MVSQTTEIPAPKATRPAPQLPSTRGRRGRRIWSILLLVLALGAVGFVAYELIMQKPVVAQGGKGGAMASRPIPVQTAVAHKGDMPIYLNALGTVTAYNTVTVRTRIDGQLMKVNFKEGQVVQKDDVLFEIDPRPYEQQLLQAQGQKARDQASLDNAKQDEARYREAGPAIPTMTLDAAVAQVRQLEAAIKVDDSQIANAELNLVYCKIPSPMTGTIGLRMVDEGNMVHAADTGGLAVVTVLKPISVIFNLPQDDLPKIQMAMAAGHAVVEAWDRDMTHKLADGVLSALDNQIDVTTAMVRLKATFANEDSALFPNQFVNIKLLVDVRRDVVKVNSAALQLSPDSTFVYIVKTAAAAAPAAEGAAPASTRPAMPDQEVEQLTVKTGPSENGETVILEGLSAGDVVVTDGVDKLVQGSKVIARAAGGSRGGRGGGAREGSSSQPATQPDASGRQRGRSRGDGDPSGNPNP